MLRPRDTETRERRRLDGRWRFAFDTGSAGRSAGWFRGPLPGDREMAVPASVNDLQTDPRLRDHVGDLWYQTLVRIPRGWAGQRILLHVESATHRAVVWVGEIQVAEHEGGYTPFEADLTAVVTPGEEVRVTVVVDNTLSFQSIPPGVVEETESGRTQRYWHDFYNYAGLHRSVWLVSTPRSYVSDVTVVTGLEGTTGTVRYTVETAGEGGSGEGGSGENTSGENTSGENTSGEVAVTLRDAEGSEVASGVGRAGELRVGDVHRWAPGDGYLYDLEVRLVDDGVTTDSYHLAVGVRTVEVRGTEFLLNGEPFYFRGFGMHEDHAVIGKAHNDAHMIHDFALLEWIGANSLRTSHYPYSEDWLEYADRRGVVVIDETAAVGLNMGLGGGIFGSQGYTTYSPETINDATQQVHAQAIRELISRDKNHPCVVLWSIANEPESETEAAELYFRPLFDVAREADPTRPVGFINVMLAPHGKCRVSQFSDVVMLNRYYGWYVDTGDLEAAGKHFRAELEAWPATASRSSSPSTGPTPTRGCTTSSRSRGRRSTRSRTSRRTTRRSTPCPRWSASRCGTSPTSRRRSGSCGSAATRRVRSRGTGSRRLRRMRSGAAGGGEHAAASSTDVGDLPLAHGGSPTARRGVPVGVVCPTAWRARRRGVPVVVVTDHRRKGGRGGR